MSNKIPFPEMYLLHKQSPINIWLTHSELTVVIEQLNLVSSDPQNLNNPMGDETKDIELYLINISQLQSAFKMESMFEKYKIKMRPFDVATILIQLSLASTYNENVHKQEIIKTIMYSLIDSIKSILELTPCIKSNFVDDNGNLQKWSNN